MKRSSPSEFASATPAAELPMRPLGPAASVETRALDAIPADWDAPWDDLAVHASEANCFAERWFVTAGIRHLPPASEARMLAVWQGLELIGLIPLAIVGNYGRAPVRHVQNWLHYHSFLGTPLVRRGCEAAFWRAILDALDQADWAPGFLHVNGLVEGGPVLGGLREAGRGVDVVHRAERAFLKTPLAPQAYYEATVRKKKRKEIGRLTSRLGELGTIEHGRFRHGDDLELWCDEFLALEMSGWKGRAGSALGCSPQTEAFLREIVAGAEAIGKLDFVRITLDGKPIAMLLNLLSPPGSFSFKIAFDEAHARFSPGVLIQIDNLAILERPNIAWMDSCAVEDHSMINSLWGQRRSIVRVTIPLSGFRRRLIFAACRAAEDGLALAKRWLRRSPKPESKESDS